MQHIKTFVAVDFETSGLDCEKNEIIEIGASKVKNGVEIDKFQALVKPEIKISFNIENLTSITNTELSQAKTFVEVLPDFLDFIGHFPLVFHNAKFDSGFLENSLKYIGNEMIPNRIYDTLHLSRILLPFVKNHQLGFLAKFFEFTLENAHRAYDDAAVTGKLFWKLLNILAEYKNLDFFNYILRISEDLDWINKDIFEKFSPNWELNQDEGDYKKYGTDSNFIESKEKLVAPKNIVKHLSNYFTKSSPISTLISDWEFRKEQLEYANEVLKAFLADTSIMLEAGTGIGKSLAYLVASILFGLQNDKRICISTNTKNLQEQLFFKDIPLLFGLIKGGFSAIILKGRRNYICLNKYHNLINSQHQILTKLERIQFLTLIKWVLETNTGDIETNTSFNSKNAYSLWAKLAADSSTCLGNKCKHYKKCFVFIVRQLASKSNLIITNQSLLLSHSTTEGSIFKNVQHYVIDEAHNFENNAIKSFSMIFSYRIIIKQYNKLHNQKKSRSRTSEFGLLSGIKKSLSFNQNSSSRAQKLLSFVNDLIPQIETHKKTIQAFFKKINRALKKEKAKLHYRVKPNTKFHNELRPLLIELKNDIVDKIEKLVSIYQIFSNDIDEEIIWDYESTKIEIFASINTLKELVQVLEGFVEPSNKNFVYWIEKNKMDTVVDIDLIAAPIDVSDMLYQNIYENAKSVIITSATLSIDKSFSYYKSRLGLDKIEKYNEKIIASPFDYKRNSALVIPSYFPDVKEDSFNEELSNFLRDLILTHKRGTLVLFASYSRLNKMYSALEQPLSNSGILLLAQGINGNRTYLVDRFKEDKKSVLFGTASFWEGIDVPGDALSNLVIIKLPFPVPNEPIVEAHMEMIAAKGANSFMEYMLPVSVIKFKQGFGRLIRKKEDRGTVFCLDNRLVTKRYGDKFLNSLPVNFYDFNSFDKCDKFMNKFFTNSD